MNSKFAGMKLVSWMFLLILALLATLVTGILVEQISFWFIIFGGAGLFVFISILWYRVVAGIANPSKRLIQGITEDEGLLWEGLEGGGLFGASGEAAKKYLDVKLRSDEAEKNYHAAAKKADALALREEAVVKLMRAWAEKDFGSLAETAALGNELGGLMSALQKSLGVLAGDAAKFSSELDALKKENLAANESLEAFKAERDGLIAETGDAFSALINAEAWQASRFGKYESLAKKYKSVFDYVKKLSDENSGAGGFAKDKAARLMELISSYSFGGGADEAAFSLTEKLKGSAANVKHAVELAEKAKTMADSAKGRFEDGLRSVKELNANIMEIDSMSGNIKKVIKSIDDISFQTQLISLNASIEAAHAGQFGRSFAVVALKVGELAGISKDSADETGKLLEGMIEKFREGAKLSEKTAGIMQSFLEGLDAIIDTVRETGDNLNAEALTANDILADVNNVAGIAKDSETAVRNIADAVDELVSEKAEIKSSGDFARGDFARKAVSEPAGPSAVHAPAPMVRPVIKADVKPAFAIKPEIKPAPVIKAEVKPLPVIKPEVKPLPVIKPEIKPAVNAVKPPEKVTAPAPAVPAPIASPPIVPAAAAKSAAKPLEKPVTVPAAPVAAVNVKPSVSKPADKPVIKPADKPVAKPVAAAFKPLEKPAVKLGTPAEKPQTIAAKPLEKPAVVKPLDKPAPAPKPKPLEAPLAAKPTVKPFDKPTAAAPIEPKAPAAKPSQPPIIQGPSVAELLKGATPLGSAIKPRKPTDKIVVSNIKPTGFDGSSEYNRKDFGKY